MGKVLFTFLKLAAIFNSATKVLIFSTDPLKVSISFNSGTFSQNALNNDSGKPSTMISVKSRRNLAKSEKLDGIWRNPANPLL
jgi:hypothetical protein